MILNAKSGIPPQRSAPPHPLTIWRSSLTEYKPTLCCKIRVMVGKLLIINHKTEKFYFLTSCGTEANTDHSQLQSTHIYRLRNQKELLWLCAQAPGDHTLGISDTWKLPGALRNSQDQCPHCPGGCPSWPRRRGFHLHRLLAEASLGVEAKPHRLPPTGDGGQPPHGRDPSTASGTLAAHFPTVKHVPNSLLAADVKGCLPQLPAGD